MTEPQLREALSEFAREVLASDDGYARAGVFVTNVRRNVELPTAINDEQAQPTYNVVATVRVQQRSDKIEEGEQWAQFLRSALEADPSLGGRWLEPVRVMPESGRAVRVVTRLDD